MLWQKHIQVWFGIFSIILIASFSFPFNVIPNIGGWLEPVFNIFTSWSGIFLDSVNSKELYYHSGEDSLGMLVNTIIVFFISSVIYITSFLFWKHKIFVLLPYFRVFFRYYLALILLIYGFDKIYKYQFYYPEPNILYTKFKDLPQDLLYWSTMGTSYSYSLFAGIIEVVPAVLLLWRRTYVLGAMIAFFVFVNVFMTNIGFDITIKIFSCFLMLLSLILLLPKLSGIYSLFTKGQGELSEEQKFPVYAKQYYVFLKVVVLLAFFYESQYKIISSGIINDDNAKRPELHGAYQVVDAYNDAWEMVYFHRQGYFIVEDSNGEFYDYKLNVDKVAHLIQLTTYELEKLSLNYEVLGDTLVIKDEKTGFFAKTVKVYSYN